MSDPAFVLKPKDLEKILRPEEIKDLQQLLQNSRKETNQFLAAPKPEPKANSDLEKDPIVTNWLGLLSNATGGFAATITYVVGNYMGLNDWNPNDGDAPVDAENKVSDTAFGDPLGNNASTMLNYLRQGAPLEEKFFSKEDKAKNIATEALNVLPAGSPHPTPK